MAAGDVAPASDVMGAGGVKAIGLLALSWQTAIPRQLAVALMSRHLAESQPAKLSRPQLSLMPEFSVDMMKGKSTPARTNEESVASWLGGRQRDSVLLSLDSDRNESKLCDTICL